MTAENYIKVLSPLLKGHGFSKSNSTWRKDQGESIAVINLQKSQWGNDDFYINLGIYFYAFGKDSAPTENKCHVRIRLPVEEPTAMASAAIKWFQERASLQGAIALAEEDSRRGFVFKQLRTNLDPTK